MTKDLLKGLNKKHKDSLISISKDAGDAIKTLQAFVRILEANYGNGEEFEHDAGVLDTASKILIAAVGATVCNLTDKTPTPQDVLELMDLTYSTEEEDDDSTLN